MRGPCLWGCSWVSTPSPLSSPPRKRWRALLYGLVFHFITDVEVNYYFLAVYGILGGVITEVGDLAFSYVKRNRKIKDFGHILPGHGGVLDRFDSVIFCAPLIELLIQWLPAFSKGAGA